MIERMDVDDYLRLSQSEDTLLHTAQDADGSLQVHEYAGERWVFTGGTSILSVMYLAAPADPILPNHVAMLAALLFCDTPRTVLNLGFGTGTFERFFHDRLPATEVVSVDTSRVMVDIAHAHFDIPADWPVIIQPAGEFLHTNARMFDLVLCDIFTGDQQPHCLRDSNFYADAARSLNPDGVMALNLSPATEQELLDILVVMRRSFANVILVNLVDYGNLVLFALQRPMPDDAQLQQRTLQLKQQLRLDFSHIPARLTQLPDRLDTVTVQRAETTT